MTNTESKQQYEGAILAQLIKNSERLVIVEQDIARLRDDVSELKNDVSELKDDVSELKDNVSQLKQDIKLVKERVDNIYDAIGTIKWILITIGLAIVANIFSQPINNFIFEAIR